MAVKAIKEKADLIGVWELDTWKIEFSDGRPDTYPFGEDAVGNIAYINDNRMYVTVSCRQREAISNENIRRAPQEERASAFDSFFHYQGTWSIEGETIVHHIDLSLNPNFQGTDQIRVAKYTGESLELSLESKTPSGTVIRNALLWKRQIKSS